MGFQTWQYILATILTISILGMMFVYFMEPAGLFIQLSQTLQMASLKLCLRAADRMESMGADILSSWHGGPEYMRPHAVQPPRYLIYAAKLTEWIAGFLRFLGNFLARGIITYRNRGAVLGSSPAQFVITARELFTGGWVEKVSFTPLWRRNVLV